MSAERKQAVRVSIAGEEYALRSEKGEEYTRECAEHVDEAIQKAQTHGRAAEPHKAAILAALEITDRMLTAREAAGDALRRVADRLEGLRERVERALDA